MAEGFTFFDQGSFGDDRQDWSAAPTAAFDFAFDFVVAARLDFPLFEDDVVEGSFGDVMEHWFLGTFVIHTFLVLVPPIATGGQTGDCEQAEDGFFHSISKESGGVGKVSRTEPRVPVLWWLGKA